MEKNHKIIIGVLIVVIAILACLITVYTLMPQEKPDNVIELENIKFNTTNATNFTIPKTGKFSEVKEIEGASYYQDNETGCAVLIFDLNKTELSQSQISKSIREVEDAPYQTINGITIYNQLANTGDNIGKPVYFSFIENKDLNMVVRFSSPDPNETAKMISSLEFKDK